MSEPLLPSHQRPRFPGLPLATRRLLLRPPRPEDADALFGIFSDAETMRYWASPPWQTRQQALDLIQRDLRLLAEGAALRLVLQPAQGGEALGAVSLFALDEQSSRAEIGYILGRPAWGQGLMDEALRALIGYAFGPLGLRRLEADIDPRNQRSARCLERLGFRREGLLRERWVVAGEVSDSALYGLLGREWAAGGGGK